MKTIDISACVAALLYEQNSVSLPGIGSINCKYKPASIDHVQGKISPPARELTFDSNLVLDDGLLAEAAAQRFETSFTEASDAVSDFTKNIQAALDQREMFSIPGVGRLYRDFEQKLQFLSDEVNFNPESYGLPALQYYPTVRRAPVEPAPATLSAPKNVYQTLAGWFQHNLLWIALATVLVVSGSIYVFKFAPTDTPGTAEVPDVPSGFLNVKPGQNEPPAEDEPSSPAAEEDLADDSEAPTLPPDQKICTIRIGRFGNEDNVKRLVRKAQEIGMNPYTKKKGSLTEVGVTFPYSDEQEIKDMLSAARKSLSKDAVVDSK